MPSESLKRPRGEACVIDSVTIPVRIESEANLRGHWSRKAARVRSQRFLALYYAKRLRIRLPCTITLVRIAPRELDCDNLASGCKALRDGVADAIGVNDRDKRIRWQYSQRRGKPGEYACVVEVEEG